MENKEKIYLNDSLKYEASLGFYAGQTNGSVWIKKGGTVVLATVIKEQLEDFPGFFPLSVDYREHYSSAGVIPGGYFKREGRPSEREILTSRIIDRILRPLFPSNYFDKISIVVTLYSIDKENLPTDICVVAASLALVTSDISFLESAGCCEIAKVKDQWVVNPTQIQILESTSKLIIAGTINGINMVEGSSNGAEEEEIIEALFKAHDVVKEQIKWQNEVSKDFNKKSEYKDIFNVENWKNKASQYLIEEKMKKIFISDKVERGNAREILWKEFKEENKQSIENDKISSSIVEYAFDSILQEKLSLKIFTENKRVDGRDFDTVRPIQIRTGLLPKAHGSGFFMRGRTQLLVITTLGSGDDEIKIENILDEPNLPFMLHYNFLPFSVGEAKSLRAPGRREIGHGFLAANAVKAVLPDKKNFPYVIRLVADVIESDGSSSMATVCGSIMSLMDAGVPIKDMVAGIAMGMLADEKGNFEIITDIAGIEDELGLMDFKIAGTEKYVTAIQMDIKHKGGLLKDIFVKAFEKAKIARLKILKIMKEELSAPRENLSELVPKFATLNIPKDKIGAVIGSGGKVIKDITEKTGCSISIEDSGLVKIFGMPGENFNKAIVWIKMIAGDIAIGSEFNGIIKKIAEFGYFVELFPNFDGFVHVSSIPRNEVELYRNKYKENDKVRVVVIDYDAVTNRIRLKIVK